MRVLNAHPCTAMSFVNAKWVGRKIPDLGRSHRRKKRETTEGAEDRVSQERCRTSCRAHQSLDIELEMVAGCSDVPAAASQMPILGP